jgi:hypothetical protein
VLCADPVSTVTFGWEGKRSIVSPDWPLRPSKTAMSSPLIVACVMICEVEYTRCCEPKP